MKIMYIVWTRNGEVQEVPVSRYTDHHYWLQLTDRKGVVHERKVKRKTDGREAMDDREEAYRVSMRILNLAVEVAKDDLNAAIERRRRLEFDVPADLRKSLVIGESE